MLGLAARGSEVVFASPPDTPHINAGRLTGPPNWSLSTNHQTIKGFADTASAADGELVSLYVTTPAVSFDVYVFRLGWYDNGTRSADLVHEIHNVAGMAQSTPLEDAQTGLVTAANWIRSTTFLVTGWRAGMYLLKLVAADGDENYIPLVIRDDRGSHDVLLVHSVNTDQAYNGWGGKSLYTFNSSGSVTVGGTVAGVKASFDRPYGGDGSGTAILSWELNMVRWLEANGFDVTYATDVEVHRDPQFASRVKAVIQAGHSEYWSKEMRDHLEDANRQGKGLGFFTGDTGSWAVRYEDSPLGSDRVLVCYRNASLDPLTTSDPPRTTTRWLSPPLNRPLQAFIGIGSNALVARSADWIVAGAEDAPELFTETGFKNGDVVSNLVGYEYDGLWTPGAGKDLPEGLTVLGQAPVIPASPLQTQRQFAVAYEWSDAAPIRLGRLSAIVQTLQVGPSWTLMLSVVSAKGLVFLQYETEIGTPYQYKVGPVPYAIIPLDATFSQLGTRPLDRDLNADYTTAFGTPPTDARVTAIVVRGSLALGALSITESDGTTYPTSKNVGTLHEANVWYVSEGKGTIGVQSGDPSPTAPLLIQATLPTDKRPDVSNTVVIKRAALGLVIAAGTIQWSWALDDYGDHVDHQGNSTKVDRRLQTLTGNLLRQLIKGTR